jgi:diaminohydroxyphosphoribosylaminopyrimidine deaminase/5-amino-6-(5-phosphoribosylamino)uracil reductase
LKKADMEYMQRAIELATQARGRTSPNPMVGAVIVKDGKIIGEGYHKKAGTPHAEIHALAAAGNEARGATLYVSLEPCCHHGRTPPCTEAIINSGIKRVVIAALDPNPKVAGGGLQRLKKAGIDAEFGLMQEAAMELNAVFFKYIQRALPYVALKTAMTLDGKIAAGSGDSRWITGPEARQHVHQLRNIYDAIMVGIGTVLADNPRLNTRLQEGQGRDPVRVIIDNQLDLPVNSIIAQSSREQPSLVFCGKEIDEHKASELSRLGVEIIKTDLENGLVPLQEVLAILAQREISSILVEGGAELNASLIEQGLVDKFYWFIAPKIIGGREAKSPVGGSGYQFMREALELSIRDIKSLGRDILITAVKSS